MKELEGELGSLIDNITTKIGKVVEHRLNNGGAEELKEVKKAEEKAAVKKRQYIRKKVLIEEPAPKEDSETVSVLQSVEGSPAKVSKQTPVAMTIEEFRDSVFYMPNNSLLAMVHLKTDSEETLFIDTDVYQKGLESYFQDNLDQKKYGPSVALLRLELPKNNCRGLLMGYKQPYDTIYEIIFDLDQEIPLHTFDKALLPSSKRLMDFCITHFMDQEYIITGREELHQRLRFYIDQEGRVAVAARELPAYKSKRYKHNSFVLRNHLFLIFGRLTDTMYAKDVEYLDLTDPEAQFHSISLSGKEMFLQHPLIFEDKLEVEDDHMFVVGGGIVNGLYRLQIAWSPEGHPTNASMHLEPDAQGQAIIFKGAKSFHPNIPHKKYLEDRNTWIFVDNSRNYYTYHAEMKRVEHTTLTDPL